MRTKKVTRYYCDHCSKGGFKKPDMVTHEESCTLNPDRVCYLCEVKIEIAPIIKELIARPDVEFHSDESPGGPSEDCYSTKSQEAINWLMGKCDGCPACALAVLRQGKVYAFEVFKYREEANEYRRGQYETGCVFRA